MNYNMAGVEIFSTATAVPSHPGYPIKLSVDDLQQIVRNFHAMTDKFRPQLKIGHDDKDGMPAFGRVTNLYVQGEKLHADFADMPEVVFRAITAGLYKQVSVEMRFSKEVGWYLTAVALLGADLPAIKNLQDLQAYLTAHAGIPDALSVSVDKQPVTFAVGQPTVTIDTPRAELRKMSTEQEKEKEIIELRAAAETAKTEATRLRIEHEALLASSRKAKFQDAKTKILAPIEEMVVAKTLEPRLRDQIAAALDAQEVMFADGRMNCELMIPAQLAMDMSKSMKPAKETATDAARAADDGSPDAILAREVFKVMAATGKNYDEATELACSANPGLAKGWLGFTTTIHMKGVN